VQSETCHGFFGGTAGGSVAATTVDLSLALKHLKPNPRSRLCGGSAFMSKVFKADLQFPANVWMRDLLAREARHHPTLLARRLDRVAAAHAVRAVVGGVERVSDAPCRRAGRLFARPPWVMACFDDRLLSGRCAGRCRYQLPRPPAAPARRRRLFNLRCLSRCRHGLPNRMLARPPSAPTCRDDRLLNRGRISLRRRWLPGRHDVGNRLCGFRSLRQGRHWCPRWLLRRKATVPRGRANILVLALRPVSHSTARSHMHYLNGPASRCAGASGDGQRLSPIS
jgi:hypothetical protein